MNRLLRKVFLAFARNPWMRERLPTLPFMQKAVRRFMPGDTIEDALGVAVDLQAAGIGTMYTRLGENIADAAQAQAVADHYLEVLDRIKAAGIDGEISVKPTQLGPRHRRGHVPRRTCGRCRRRPRPQGSYLWIDMEDSSYVDRTLDLYQRLRSTHAQHRHLPPGLPAADGAGRGAAAAARPRRSGSSRAPTTSRPRSPSARARRSTPTTSGSRSRSRGRAARGRSGWASAPTTSS